jgi:serine/threonine-protein kinase
LIYSALGDRAETMRWLTRAYHEKDVHMVFLGVDPKWDGMRGQPEFDSLLGKMKLGVRHRK